MRDLLARVARRGRSPGAQELPPASEVGPAPPGKSDGTSRRSLISRGIWLFAGAVGAGVVGNSFVNGSRTSPAAAAPPLTPAGAAGPTTMTLRVRDVRYTSSDLKPGALPDANVLLSPHGQLVDDADAVLGSFSGGMLPGSGGQIAFQRFTFADGTIIGMGSGSLEGEEYAVVGGTGRFAGALGTYLTRLEPGERGRDAEFVVSIVGKG